MNIVIAPDSFKESLSAIEVADAIAAGFAEVLPSANLVKIPMADGGEGSAATIVAATGGQLQPVRVHDPLGRSMTAHYGLSPDGRTAIIEMAACSGLHLVAAHERQPLTSTSRGMGEAILAALEGGASRLLLCIGGSASTDGGMGLLQALGVRFVDDSGVDLGAGGAELVRLAQIDVTALDARLAHCQIDIACDVDNPLLGDHGAAAVFGPQKGASPDDVALLEQGLSRYAEVMARTLKQDVADLAGAGAAGGVGAALMAVLKGRLRPGHEIIAATVGLAEHIAQADWVITGEGRIDSQTIFGKTPIGVAKLAKQYRKPVIAIAGGYSANADVVHEHGIDALFSAVHEPCTVAEALANAEHNVRQCARNVAQLIKLAQASALG
ncbi:MAG: glycerate kinase [Neisseriaceae bacterium]|nr:glycerate kinase [Neisseriaceae bacterium]